MPRLAWIYFKVRGHGVHALHGYFSYDHDHDYDHVRGDDHDVNVISVLLLVKVVFCQGRMFLMIISFVLTKVLMPNFKAVFFTLQAPISLISSWANFNSLSSTPHPGFLPQNDPPHANGKTTPW